MATSQRCGWRLIAGLPEGAESIGILQAVAGQGDCDEYDVVAGEIFGETARLRLERVERLEDREAGWLEGMGSTRSRVVAVLSRQFGLGGTPALESAEIFNVPTVLEAGGIKALEGDRPPAAELLLGLDAALADLRAALEE